LASARKPVLPERLPVRMGAIPTTLSGGEFTGFAGCTDLDARKKEAYAHPEMVPRFVILDPAVTTETPTQTWLSTGMRAIDHAVETLCSPVSMPIAEGAALQALSLLPHSLRRTSVVPMGLPSRLDSQCGVWLSTVGLQSGVPMGASHGIGHSLGGTAGVPHGVTSCLMLPHVLRWNSAVNTDRQRRISTAMGAPDVDAADLISSLVGDLGLPRRLRDCGVRREQFLEIAVHAFDDPWTRANPRRIENHSVIMQMLEEAW
jgi:maleylacetate reductase